MRSQKQTRGFTLMEMLIVITIIALLATILVPSIYRVRRSSMRFASIATIHLLDGGCRAYSNDFGGYPWSGQGSGNSGAERLVSTLTGYNLSHPSDRLYGFQTQARGRIYGPYNGAEGVKLTKKTGSYAFADAFGNPIFYYRYNEDGTYHDGDNPNPFDFGAGNTTININNYASNGGTYYQKDFVLCSPGANQVWDPPAGGGDDATNFPIQ